LIMKFSCDCDVIRVSLKRLTAMCNTNRLLTYLPLFLSEIDWRMKVQIKAIVT
jgi:hypothetical protein